MATLTPPSLKRRRSHARVTCHLAPIGPIGDLGAPAASPAAKVRHQGTDRAKAVVLVLVMEMRPKVATKAHVTLGPAGLNGPNALYCAEVVQETGVGNVQLTAAVLV